MNKAQQRKEQPVFRGLARYFPDALKYVAWVSLQGNLQHHPDEPLHWDRAKSTDEMDALMRHSIDAGDDWDCVDDDGVLHLGKTAWRSLAALQKVLERKQQNMKEQLDTLTNPDETSEDKLRADAFIETRQHDR